MLCFDYLSDSNELCVVWSSGLVYTLNSFNEVRIQSLMFLTALKLFIQWHEQGRITDAEAEASSSSEHSTADVLHGGDWSPDIQILVVATDAHLIAISRDFETICKVPLRPKHAGKGKSSI